MTFRTDSHNNPTAFTTDLAVEAGLVLGADYEKGDSFSAGSLTLYTARILGPDPVALTIKVIDTVGFYTHAGYIRWNYIAIPYAIWMQLSTPMKASVIGGMYHREGGTEMLGKFPTPMKF